MTNEELAENIALGGADELLPKLWENTRKYFYKKADSYYRAHSERCKSVGIEAEDLKQECYIAMLDAVKAYGKRTEEHRETKFLSFTGYHIKLHFAELLGYRTKTDRLEPLNNVSVSLDEPVERDSEEATATRGELIADNRARVPFDEIEERALISSIRKATAHTLKNDKRLARAIELVYFQGKTQQQAAEVLGVSSESVRQYLKKAYKILKRDEVLREIARAEGYYCRISPENCKRGGSLEERIVEARERLGCLWELYKGRGF